MKIEGIYLVILLFISACDSDRKEILKSPDGTDYEITFPANENDNWTEIGYYPSGKPFVKKIINKIDSSEITNAYWYFPNGHIFKYKLYRFNDLAYYRDYSFENEIIKIKGNPIVYSDSINHIEFSKKDKGARRIVAASPPNCKIELLVCDWTPDSISPDSKKDHCVMPIVKDGESVYPFGHDITESFKKKIYWLITDTIREHEEKGGFTDQWIIK